MPEERFLTKAQAEQLKREGRRIAAHTLGKTIYWAYERAIDEATVQPGDMKFCYQGKFCIYWQWEHTTPPIKGHCARPDHTPGHCPDEEKEEK